MHVLIATDGSGDVAQTAKFGHALAGSDGETTVATIVVIPRQLVSGLREQWGEQEQVSVDSDGEYVGVPDAAESIVRSFPGDDAMVDQYIANKRDEACKPVTDAVRALGGAAASAAIEGTDVTEAIMGLAAEINADVIVVSSHGRGAFQGLLGSTGAKLVRRARRPVLVLR